MMGPDTSRVKPLDKSQPNNSGGPRSRWLNYNTATTENGALRGS